MDHTKLLAESHFTSLNGSVMSAPEKASLQSSLVLLKKQRKLNKVYYWGKVVGIQNDYHVAEGITDNAFDTKVVCYSVDGGLTWLSMPDIQENEYQYLTQIRGYFSGDPSYTYDFEAPQGDQPQESSAPAETEGETNEEVIEEEGEGEDAGNQKASANVITISESTRLAFVVASIAQDTSVVPRGAFILKNDGSTVVPNETFQGLSDYQAGKLESYVHLREPVRVPLKSVLERDALDKTLDFCDTLDEDVPNKCWSLQFNNALATVAGKSLLWPGYVFYHQPNQNTFGSFYIGNGCKNYDLCFMTRGTDSIPTNEDD